MKKIIDYMKSMFQKVEQEPTRPLLKHPLPKMEPDPAKTWPSTYLPPPKKIIDPSDVYDEDVSDRIGHINFNKLRRLRETGGHITRIFYKDSDLID